ncbi:MAG: response regulator [Terriglobia bacterium]
MAGFRGPWRPEQTETINVNRIAPTDRTILIVEGNPASRHSLETACSAWGYDVAAVPDGRTASKIMASDQAPLLAILGAVTSRADHFQVLRSLRRIRRPGPLKLERPVYVILLTAGGKRDGGAERFVTEADDYVIQPFDPRELRARIQVGFRVTRLQIALTERVLELEDALGRVKNLQGLLPMCSYCKRIRNDRNYWQQVESYIAEHSAAEFTHGVCPHCYETIVKPELEQLRTQ